MPGNSTYTPSADPLVNLPPTRVFVAYWQPDDAGVYSDPSSSNMYLLPNIRLISTQARDGAAPAVARYRYEFSDVEDPAFPRRWEQVFPYTAFGDYIVGHDDRIVAYALLADGSLHVVADGFALAPQLSTDEGREEVTFECQGAEVREWDTPLGGAIVRDGDRPSTVPDPEDSDIDAVRDTECPGVPTRFNPDGRPNASPKDFDTDQGGAFQHPVFLSPLIVREPDVRRHWSLGMACRYLMAVGWDAQAVHATTLPDFALIEGLLQAIQPTQDGGVIDPEDPDSYKYVDILVSDKDVTGKAWPDAVAEVIGPHGFGVRWELETAGGSDQAPPRPVHRFVVYRKDTARNYQQVAQQPAGPGRWIDFNKTNAPIIHVQRDSAGIANRWYADTQARQYEVSVVLAPGFTPLAGDEADATKDTFTTEAVGAVSEKYRLYHAAEAGDDWYDIGDETLRNTAIDLSAVFQYEEDDADEVRRYARTRRPPLRTLFSKDDKLKSLEAELHIATDYDPTVPEGVDRSAPHLWDPADTATHWRKVEHGWKLLDDRLGITITAKKAYDWHIGDFNATQGNSTPFRSNKVNAIACLSAPTTGDPYPRFWLRLTCVIEDDRDLDVKARKRASSPTRFVISRRDDGRDRFHYRVIDRSSIHAPGGKRKVFEDDGKDAQSHVDARRRAHEYGKYAGTATIPWVTRAYRLGDKVYRVAGRNVDLGLLAAVADQEGQIYPSIVGLDWLYEPKQSTTIHLEDLRAEAVLAANFNREAVASQARKAAGGTAVVQPVAATPAAARKGPQVQKRKGPVDTKTIT